MQKHLEDYAPPAGKWGFINDKGEIAIGAKYDDVRPFTEGLAAVVDRGLWGYINSKGESVIETSYMKAHPFVNGLARVRGSTGLVGLINVKNDTITPLIYHEIGSPKAGLYPVTLNRKKGIINEKNKIVIDILYDDVKIVYPTLFAVKNNEKFEIIDEKGKAILANVSRVRSNGIIQIGNKWGAIDAAGDFIIDPKEENIYSGSFEKYIVKRGKAYGLLNTNDLTWNRMSNSRIRYLGSNRFGIKREGKYFLTDENGKVLFDQGCDAIYAFSEGVAAYCQNEVWGYIDVEGKVIVEPVFVLPWKSSESKVRFLAQGGFGFHDTNGRLVIEPRFEDVRDFSEGLAAYMVE